MEILRIYVDNFLFRGNAFNQAQLFNAFRFWDKKFSDSTKVLTESPQGVTVPQTLDMFARTTR